MTDTCEKCGGVIHTIPLENYEQPNALYGGIGVELVNGAVKRRECAKCGAHCGAVEIPDPEGLTAAVVVARATDALKLNGREIKFMRKAMEFTAKELADLLDVTEETISRWETG